MLRSWEKSDSNYKHNYINPFMGFILFYLAFKKKCITVIMNYYHEYLFGWIHKKIYNRDSKELRFENSSLLLHDCVQTPTDARKWNDIHVCVIDSMSMSLLESQCPHSSPDPIEPNYKW